MVVTTSVKAAGGFVLPESIMQLSDISTVTAPTEGLTTNEEFAANLYANPGVLLSAGNELLVSHKLATNLDQLGYFERNGYKLVHLYRCNSDLNRMDFCGNELVPSLKGGPWSEHDWFKQNIYRVVEMLPLPSQKHAGLLSYYQTPEKRARDLRTPIKPGRWLKKYFNDILSETEIHELALEWSTKTTAPKVTITQDADEIEEVYTNGPRSCMAYGANSFSSPIHPTRVYAGPDLAIAYLGDRNDATARAVIWPEKKIWSTIYGDMPRLSAALVALGYQSGNDDEFDGARLQRIPHDGGFVLPYLDSSGYVQDNGSFLVIGGSEFEAQTTNGLTEGEPQSSCYDCDQSMDEDDEVYIECNGTTICQSCCDQNYFYCDGYDGYYPDNRQAQVVDTVTDSYSEGYLANNPKWFFCNQSDKFYPRDRYQCVETYQGEVVALEVAEEEGFYCEYVEAWVLDSCKKGSLNNGAFIDLEQFHSEDHLARWLAERDLTLIEQDPSPLTEQMAA